MSLKSDFVQFSIESRILKELGEQLVSDPQVAMTELIKNSFDADATTCELQLHDNSIFIIDNGHGMTIAEFKSRWMTIATSNKEQQKYSRHYSRKLTGSKGVGRFAVRFLGELLKIETVAEYDNGKRFKISAIFDWNKIDEAKNLKELRIPYTLTPTDEDPGTMLMISRLRHTLGAGDLRGIKSGVLNITSPVYAFVAEAPASHKKLFEASSFESNLKDPGFSLDLSAGEEINKNLADQVLQNAVARTTISIKGSLLEVKVFHVLAETSELGVLNGYVGEEKNIIYYAKLKFPSVIGSDTYLDIRYFPRRAGIFHNKGFNGKDAWAWIRSNNGVGIYDHGFRIRPYGYDDDDWLRLDRDTAHNSREWGSDLMKQLFPMSEEERTMPKLNPMIGIPTNYQSIGAVFVQSGAGSKGIGLSPSMDRQGFVLNASFKQLREVSRFAVELIAFFDKKLNLEVEKKERDKLLNSKKGEIQAAIDEVRKSSTLTSEDKHRIIQHYSRIRDDIERIDEYDRESREGLTLMSLLGVVAGFMTHEFQAALMTLENASYELRNAAKSVPSLLNHAKSIEKTVEYFTGYIDYTKLFISNVQSGSVKEYRALPAINNVLNTFSRFQDERKVSVIIDDVSKELVAPLIPAAMYQGIVHNLYTNALKALLNHSGKNKVIKIQAWNEGSKKHVLQVLDNGPGIPAEVANRIWDPLYTTSSTDNNPLGSGMGLGLPLIKKVIETRKGKIYLAEAPAGFSTCFRVELPAR